MTGCVSPLSGAIGDQTLLYTAHELNRAWLTGASAWASAGVEMLGHPMMPMDPFGIASMLSSALEVFAHAAAPRGKPAFDIEAVTVDGKSYPVTEAIVVHRAFGNLLRFSHTGLPEGAPKLLIVAPMSGHFATLLRGTLARMLERAEVFITDWHDAREVPLAAGKFTLDDYIDELIRFLEHIGPDAHMMAVCQPSVPALAATALMNADRHACRPLTLTMMGGPVDTREAPTSVNDVATQRAHSWFKNNVIATVPLSYPGGGRKVYPGFLQLAGFMAMNLQSHLQSHYQMYQHLVEGDGESADATKAFYDEYRSTCDLHADYYLQTIDHVFQQHSLPRGLFFHGDRKVDIGAITDTALLAIEGENDDISGIGQTRAALKLATGLSESRKQYYLAAEVGHYGIFNGSKWRGKIAPVVEAWMQKHASRKQLKVAA